MQGTTSVIITNSYRHTIWFLCGQKGAADLQRPSNGTVMHARSGIGCTLSPSLSPCLHSSSWAAICAVFAGHPWRIASQRVPQKLHYKRVRSESLLDLIHVIVFFFHVSVPCLTGLYSCWSSMFELVESLTLQSCILLVYVLSRDPFC